MKKLLFTIVILFLVTGTSGCLETSLKSSNGKDAITSFGNGNFFIGQAEKTMSLFPSMGGTCIIKNVEAMYESGDKVYLIGENEVRISKKTETGAIEYEDISYTSYAVIDLQSNTMQIFNKSNSTTHQEPFLNQKALEEGILIELQSFSEFTEGDQAILENWENDNRFIPIG